jgi:hypothetical protein
MKKNILSFLNINKTEESIPLLSEQENIENECVICLDDLKDKDTTVLHCGHEFHSECIESWTSIQITCPMCRSITETKFKGYVIPTIWCMFFKRKATIKCNKNDINLNIKYLFSTKNNTIPYPKIHSVSATEDYLVLHLKKKNITIQLDNMNVSCLYNLLYNILHNGDDHPPF